MHHHRIGPGERDLTFTGRPQREGQRQGGHREATDPAEREPWMPPDGSPERRPPRIAHGVGLLAPDPGFHGGPEAGPVRLLPLGEGRLDQAPELELSLHTAHALRTVLEMRLDRARETRAEGSVGIALQARAVPQTGGVEHVALPYLNDETPARS